MNCKLDKLDRTNELLELIKDQNEGVAQLTEEPEDISGGLAKCLKAREAREEVAGR